MLQPERMACADDGQQQAPAPGSEAALEAAAEERRDDQPTPMAVGSKTTTTMLEDGTATWPLPSSCGSSMSIVTAVLDTWGVHHTTDFTLVLPSGERLSRRLQPGIHKKAASVSQWRKVTQRLLPVRGGDIIFMRATSLQPLEVEAWATRNDMPVEPLPPPPRAAGVLLTKSLTSADFMNLDGHPASHKVFGLLTVKGAEMVREFCCRVHL